MAIKRQGIVARPGTHKRGGMDEVVSAEQLKRAIQIQNRIPLILGPHPAGPGTDPLDIIGTVTQRWNEAEQRVDGDFWFFNESEEELVKWLSIPQSIRDKIVNYEKVPLSACYQIGKIKEGVQIGRLYDHLVLDVDRPMHTDVGVNVRMESELPENYRIETESEISEVPPEKEEPKPVEDRGFSEKQLRQLAELVKAMIPSPPAEPERPEVEATEEVQEAPPAPTLEQPKVEPEKVIARSTAPSEDDYPYNDDMVAVSHNMFKKEETK